MRLDNLFVAIPWDAFPPWLVVAVFVAVLGVLALGAYGLRQFADRVENVRTFKGGIEARFRSPKM